MTQPNRSHEQPHHHFVNDRSRLAHRAEVQSMGRLQAKVTAMLGANGAGKSSTIMCIAGHVTVMSGKIIYDGKEITGATPMARVKAGIAVVPEGRRLFPSLTVKENLIVRLANNKPPISIF